MTDIKLDEKGKKMLNLVRFNARIPLTTLAKKVGLSKESASYRLKSMVDKGILSKFVPELNFHRMRMTIFRVALKLNNIDEKLEAEIGEYLHTLPSIWVGYMYGEWDIMFGVLVKGPLEFDSHMSKIMQKFGQHISEKAICIQVNDFFLDYNHIYEKYSNEQIESFKEESDDIVILDDFDKQIIAHLYDNARISYLEISQKMNVSPGLIKKRIIKLEKNKVIKRYMTSMDRTQLGYRKYKTLLYFNNLSLEVKNKVLTYCLSIPNITHVTTTTGSWDLEIDYDAKDLTEFHTLFRDFRNKFSSQLVDYSVLLSYNYKYINPLKQIKL